MERAHRSAAARSVATSRPAGGRVPAAAGRVAQARRCRRSRRAPINPSQITAHRRGPRSVSRFRSSERSAGLASPRASIGCPVMSSGTATSRRSSTVGATSVELISPSVRVESGIQRCAPSQPGGPGRHEPPGDVARVLDHQHQVGGATRCEELAELSMPGRPGWQLHDQHIGVAPQDARGARRPPRGARAPRARHDPTGRPRRPPPGCGMSAGPRSRHARRPRERTTQAGPGPRPPERYRPVRRSPAMRTCGRPAQVSDRSAPRRRRATWSCARPRSCRGRSAQACTSPGSPT